jgi:hypothetical protein
MTRQYPPEIYIGQTVDVHVDPSSAPIEALVIFLDFAKGLVYVDPIGYDTRWAAQPRVITLNGLYLHFENNDFFFSPMPIC